MKCNIFRVYGATNCVPIFYIVFNLFYFVYHRIKTLDNTTRKSNTGPIEILFMCNMHSGK